MRLLRILPGALLLAAVSIVFTATPAHAHVRLVSSDPKDGAKLAEAPEQVVLTFTEALDVPSTKVAVTGPDGKVLDAAGPDIADKTITQPLRLPAEGEYTVSYRIVSADGHPVEDSVRFTAASVPEENRTTAPAQKSSQAADDTEAASDSGVGWGLVGGVAAGVVVLVAVAVVVARRRFGHRG